MGGVGRDEDDCSARTLLKSCFGSGFNMTFKDEVSEFIDSCDDLMGSRVLVCGGMLETVHRNGELIYPSIPKNAVTAVLVDLIVSWH